MFSHTNRCMGLFPLYLVYIYLENDKPILSGPSQITQNNFIFFWKTRHVLNKLFSIYTAYKLVCIGIIT